VTLRVPGLAGHAKALTATFGALALITGVAAAVAPSVLASQDVPSAEATAGPTLATGAAAVSQPSIPATCETLDAQLETSDELFSSSDESSPPDTARIQDALNSCSGKGEAVVLAPSGSDNAFLSGPLSLPASVTLVVDDGATLYASRDPANYQVSGQATCGTTASTGNGCKPFINVTGSDAGIMGTQGSNGAQGEIDGRGDQDILGTSTTWWALSSQAQTDDDQQNNPRLIESDGFNNLTVYDIDLVNAPLFHIYFQSGSGLTVWGVRIKTPATARNTDGIDPDSSTDVTVNDSYIQDGDDGIAIKTNASAASDITIENSHFTARTESRSAARRSSASATSWSKTTRSREPTAQATRAPATTGSGSRPTRATEARSTTSPTTTSARRVCRT
jgi:polygalacturonase